MRVRGIIEVSVECYVARQELEIEEQDRDKDVPIVQDGLYSLVKTTRADDQRNHAGVAHCP